MVGKVDTLASVGFSTHPSYGKSTYQFRDEREALARQSAPRGSAVGWGQKSSSGCKIAESSHRGSTNTHKVKVVANGGKTKLPSSQILQTLPYGLCSTGVRKAIAGKMIDGKLAEPFAGFLRDCF